MAAVPVEKFAGSLTATASEQILAESGGTNDLGTAGVFQLRIDMNALANGDIIEVRCYTKARSADTIRQEWLGTFSNVQSNINRATPPVTITAYAKFTIVQTAHPSSFKAIPWSVMQL